MLPQGSQVVPRKLLLLRCVVVCGCVLSRRCMLHSVRSCPGCNKNCARNHVRALLRVPLRLPSALTPADICSNFCSASCLSCALPAACPVPGMLTRLVCLALSLLFLCSLCSSRALCWGIRGKATEHHRMAPWVTGLVVTGLVLHRAASPTVRRGRRDSANRRRDSANRPWARQHGLGSMGCASRAMMCDMMPCAPSWPGASRGRHECWVGALNDTSAAMMAASVVECRGCRPWRRRRPPASPGVVCRQWGQFPGGMYSLQAARQLPGGMYSYRRNGLPFLPGVSCKRARIRSHQSQSKE